MRVHTFVGYSKKIYDPCFGCRTLYIRRSMFGLIPIYNRLPQDVVDLKDVSEFQSELQTLVKKAVNNDHPSWHNFFRD